MQINFLEQAARLYGISPVQLTSLSGGHTGNPAFEFQRLGKPYVLRILVEDPQPALTQGMLEVMAYLSRRGAPVARILPSLNQRPSEAFGADGKSYLAFVLEKAPGVLAETLSPEQWEEGLFERIGAATGQIHQLAKGFQPSLPAYHRPDWEAMSVDFIDGKVIQAVSREIQRRNAKLVGHLRSLPRPADAYGLVHNDLHFANFYISPDQITVFDFDDCCYGWYAIDIAMALFDALALYPGQDRQEFAGRFMRSYLHGYLRHNQLDPVWITRMPDFLKMQEIWVFALISSKVPNLDNLDEWSRKFMPGREQRILADLPYVELDFSSLVNL